MYTQKMMDEDAMCEGISNRIEASGQYCKAPASKVIGTLTLEDAYYFKGSSNCVMTICTMDDGTINIISQYGERMMTCLSIKNLATFLSDLMSGKYA